jgi:serine/threonine-protein phosphatase 6 regulatory subunit 3
VADILYICVFISSSLFTNSNWFTFDGARGINDRLAASVPSSSPNSEGISLETEGTDDGKVIGTEDQMETVYLGNGAIEEAKDVVECTEQPNRSTEAGPLEDTEGMERHPDAANGDTVVSMNEAASVAPESSPPSVEVERKIKGPAGSSDLDNPVSEALPDPDVNRSEPANPETSSEQVTHDTDVQQPTNEVTAQNVEVPVQNVGATDPGVIKGNE